MNSEKAKVGIFWEFGESQFGGYLDPLIVGQFLIEVSILFSSSHTLSRAQVFVNSCEKYFAEAFNSLGIEVVSVENNHERLSSAFISSILLWLWDSERTSECSGNPLVIIVPSNTEILPTLGRLKSRNVQVVVAINPLATDRVAWEECSSYVIDLNNMELGFDEILRDLKPNTAPLPNHSANLNYSNSSESVVFKQHAFLSTEPRNVHMGFPSSTNRSTLNPRNISQNQFLTGNRLLLAGDNNSLIKHEDKGFHEHNKLVDDLANAFGAKNVQVILNKILAQTHQEGITFLYLEAEFLLNCIQWCFGGQKGDNIDSFTYKMNKNIAKWLLKEIQKKNLTLELQEQLHLLTLSVCQSILRQVPELELALEMLSMFKIPKPINVLLPFISSWHNSLNPSVVEKVHSFAEEMGVSMGISQIESQSSRALHRPPSFVSQSLDLYSRGSAWNTEESYQVDLSKHQQSFSDLLDMQVINGRLLSILRKSPLGVLGSRVPEIYMAAYGEPLQLPSRRLKHVLLGLGCVEMVGSDGPGDKVFRLLE